MQGNKGKIAESIKKAEPLFMGGEKGRFRLDTVRSRELISCINDAIMHPYALKMRKKIGFL